MTPELTSRYAVYFSPEQQSPWFSAGNSWLGRDAETGNTLAQPQINHIPLHRFSELTASPRRYGFHATMKAPFQLVAGASEKDLFAQLALLCKHAGAITIAHPRLQMLGDFLAIQADEQQDEIAALAQACVLHFDSLRAPMTDAELRRRRQSRLSQRHEELLLRWGYPYTEEAYRFHMTLSDSLAQVEADTVARLLNAAERHFNISAPIEINNLSIFKEDAPGAAFKLIHRRRF
ncbi:DUF1045 domain-containing protein [Undibacterium sp. Xuan67W]|uniref:DUF1045 domain-containing protein n=1 Tax=Undibacterium sp. Xuan67W TaxID=3413057 RepID=UPI003BF21502